MLCRSCDSQLDGVIYVPFGSMRGSRVHHCNRCGLVQSHFTEHRDPNGTRRVSGDAGWQNVRHGKTLRTDRLLPTLLGLVDELPAGATVLEIGSSKGDLISRIFDRRKDLNLVAFEPHLRHFPQNKYPNGVKLYPLYIEELSDELPERSVDLILSVQSLEHHENVGEALKICHAVGSDACKLFVDVPDLLQIQESGNIEEFFIDTHRCHFSAASLTSTLAIHGWKVCANARVDARNLTIVATKQIQELPATNSTSQCIRNLLVQYDATRKRNRANLISKVGTIEEKVGSKAAAIWGCGRIFDLLVRYGNLDVQNFRLLDSYLSPSMAFGRAIEDPQTIDFTTLDVVVVCAASGRNEIIENLSTWPVEILDVQSL